MFHVERTKVMRDGHQTVLTIGVWLARLIFLRTLLDKKYALPHPVVDAVVFHFLHFMSDDRELPVLWHQSLLAFVQHYKQKEGLLELIRHKCHCEVTPEIRREIVNSSRSRDSEKNVTLASYDNSYYDIQAIIIYGRRVKLIIIIILHYIILYELQYGY